MNEQNIPIDISIRKLLDWLISRRICTRDWHEAAVKIREKIGEAMQDMPENEAMKELLLGAHINYFHCQKIVDILKETEADSKNFFGQYGSKRMKDWKQIVSDYEQGNVYLAEGAQILIQNTVYEIPGMKKHSTKLEQVQADCDKREASAKKRIDELEQEFRKQCKQLGVEGERIKAEVLALARGLPDTYTGIAGDAALLQDAVTEYQQFIQAQMEGEEEGVKVVENLRFLIDHGNTTTYQWKYGEKPISVEEPVLDLEAVEDEDNNEHESGGIDFGDDGEIDFGGDGEDAIDFGAADGDIDFGDGDIDFGDDGAVEQIDFGGDLDSVDTSTIVVEEGGLAGGVARHEEALSILDNRRTRTLLIDELEELLGFLTQRLVETDSESVKFSLSAGGGGAGSADTATLRGMVATVEQVLGALTAASIQQLQMIRDSPAYADRIVDNLKQKRRLKDKVESSITEIRRRSAEAAAEELRNQEQIRRVQDKTALLQQQIQDDLSARYKGRPVYISGK